MIFSIKPSQWINLGWILFGIIGSPLILPPLIALYMIIHVYCWRYEFHEGFIVEHKGVFTVHRTEINLHRIKSIRLVQPFLFRFVGLSTVHLISSDPFKPYMKIIGIPYGEDMVTSIKEETDIYRKRKGLTESDIHIL
jgi:membrane protein YdbS with pleckstrin-like domain